MSRPADADLVVFSVGRRRRRRRRRRWIATRFVSVHVKRFARSNERRGV